MKTSLTIATRNRHKAQEIARILPNRYELHTLAEYPDAPEADESGRTFAENARLKAECVSAKLPGLVLADDSGLCVDALGGAPGIRSARFAGEHGNDEANNRKLLQELSTCAGQEPFSARFVCAMSLARDGKEIAAFEGTVEGVITLLSQGEGGFGYDPLFIPEGYSCTFAALGEEVKNRISHRAQALRRLANYLS